MELKVFSISSHKSTLNVFVVSDILKLKQHKTFIYSSVFGTARAAKGNPVSKQTSRQGSLLLMSDTGQVSMESSLCDPQISALLPHISPSDSSGQ